MVTTSGNAVSWVIVTGAAGGIGLATCRQLMGQGLAVFMVDLSQEALDTAAEDIRRGGGEVAVFAADATQPEQVAAAVAAAESQGRIDVLVNLAGGSGATPIRTIEEMTDAIWNHVITLNLTSAFLFSRAVVPGMRARGYGRIINFSSTAAYGRKGPVTTQGARLAYAAAKAALIGFTAQLAKDEIMNGITVNALVPSLILAEQGSRIRERFSSLPAEAQQAMMQHYPIGRAGEAEEVAATVGFLASGSASYISGVALPVDAAMLGG